MYLATQHHCTIMTINTNSSSDTSYSSGDSDASSSTSLSSAPTLSSIEYQELLRQSLDDQTKNLHFFSNALTRASRTGASLKFRDLQNSLDGWLGIQTISQDNVTRCTFRIPGVSSDFLGNETLCWTLAFQLRTLAQVHRLEEEDLRHELVITRKEVLDLRKQVSDLRVNTNNAPPPGSWSWHQCCLYGVIGLESGSRVLRLDDKYRPVTWVIKKTYTVIKNRIGKPKKAIPAELLPVERISSTTACIGMPVTPPTPPPYPL
jgi:hypothetical protein